MQSKPFAVLNVPRGGTGGVWRVDLAAQNASISSTDLVSAGSVDGGLYVIKGIARVTTIAATSSSVNIGLAYTDDDGGSSITANIQGLLGSGSGGIVITPTNVTTGAGIFYFTYTLNARAGVAIQYLTTYNSNPASTMQYSLHLLASRF